MKNIWHRFTCWQGWRACGSFFSRGWRAFVSWSGWRACGRFFAKGWKKTVSWSGWRRLISIPGALLALLAALCAAGLAAVFVMGWVETVPAYLLYALSFYTLVVLCARVPGLIRKGKGWISRHPAILRLTQDEELKFRLDLYREQVVNFGYGIFKIVSGVVYGSAWIGADGIYNLAQACIQLYQILQRRKPMTKLQQWKSYRVCGVLVLLLHLTLTGLVFQMVNWGRAEDYPGFMIFATAAFAFYKIISAFADVAKDRKHAHPVDSSVRMLELSQALFSMFSLQVSMLAAFGTGEAWERWLNTASGCVVCLMVVAMGIYMIRRANRDMKKEQEQSHA